MTGAHVTQGTDARLLRQRLEDPSRYALSPGAIDRLVDTATGLLARHEEADGSITGLALGYVQSGKTLSFTALAALAADRSYSFIIVLVGSTNILRSQNTDRLVEDLGLEERTDYVWAHEEIDTFGNTDVDALRRNLQGYLAEDRTVLVTVQKNHNRVSALAEVLEGLRFDAGRRALVVDDEADQISLNAAFLDDERSATYAAILRLRDALPNYLYVQYTATPYAPMLIEESDHLSPQFIEMIEPGAAYTGGEVFFVERPSQIVREVSADEASDEAPLTAPEGLRSALATFVVGCVLARRHGIEGGPPWSMLVHVSHLQADHHHWTQLVETTLEGWRARMGRNDHDPGRDDLIARAFRPAYLDLTEGGIPEAEGWEGDIYRVLLGLKVHQVNSSPSGVSGEIPWRNHRYHVLVGGNKLDRGFTVRGLTVTYLTRNVTNSNADTVEQRARSFGYKRPYLELCRFFAQREVVAAYRALVDTEADLRRRLEEWAAEGRPFKDFARDVGLLIPDRLNPTRGTVASPGRFRLSGWHVIGNPSLEPDDLEANDSVVERLALFEAPRVRFGSNQQHHHLVSDVGGLLEVIQSWQAPGVPGWPRDALTRGLRSRQELGGDAGVDVLGMVRPDGQPRERTWGHRGVSNLMQGRDAGTGYPGDRRLQPEAPDSSDESPPSRPQLQVHRLSLNGTSRPVHTLALFMPVDSGEYVVR